MEYLTTVEMSEKWNITSRRIGVLCAKGRVEGAIKKGKTWLTSRCNETSRRKKKEHKRSK